MLQKPLARELVCLALSASLSLPAGATDCPSRKTFASDAELGDQFGIDLSLDDDWAIVGARGVSVGGIRSGAAYMFRREADAWVEDAKLVPADGADGDEFGHAVAVSGTVAVVGAYVDDAWRGSAYVFRHDGVRWAQEVKLIASDAAEGAAFGFSVSVSGDVVVVGARDADRHGAAYVFRHDGTRWVEEQKLVGSDSGPGQDAFGDALSIRGDVILIGAPFAGPLVPRGQAGAAYVFRHDGSAWVEEAKLVAGDAPASYWFGRGVSLSDGLAMIGANANGGGLELGVEAAYLFRHDGGAWLEEDRLVGSDAVAREHYRDFVAVSGDLAILGSRDEPPVAPTFGTNGAAYLFRRVGGTWVEERKLKSDDPARNDFFGSSVEASGERIAIGVGGDDERGSSAGAVYFLDCPPPDPCEPPEISPAGLDEGSGAFLVRKVGADLLLRWEETAFEVGIYTGTLGALRSAAGYDHGASMACRLTGSDVLLSEPLEAESYLLVVGSACEGPRRTGPAGYDSLGNLRPAAEAVGGAECP